MLLWAVIGLLPAQAQNTIFDQFSNEKNVSYVNISKALLSIDLGVAYATWCAGGIVATTIISAAVFGQKVNTVGVIAIILIIVGCVILNLFGTSGK